MAGEFEWVASGPYPDQVIDEIRGCLAEKTYVSRWWIELEPEKAYHGAWQQFREQILHRTRFVFWAGKDNAKLYEGAGQVSVARILNAIGSLLVEFELITTLPAGTSIRRARGHARKEDSQDWRAADLGTNLPKNRTGSTRMSPAGIPLFYGADDVPTTLAEVARTDPHEFFTVGEFITTGPMTIVDLTDLPVVPSIFDPKLGQLRGQLIFLNDLVRELRQPIDRDRSHLDYVPTQVFSEYLLRVFDTSTGFRGNQQ